MSTGKITHLKDIETETLRQRIEFLELQVQGYRQNCERLEQRVAELEGQQEEDKHCCGTCAHKSRSHSEHPCRECRYYARWKATK